MAAAGRGVLYMVWGEEIEPVLQRSIASVRSVHPELGIHVERLPGKAGNLTSLVQKTAMFACSPFEETLFLDADTVVLDRLDFAFEKARQFGLACTICEAPWARRYQGLTDRGDIIEYNTGVLFFTPDAEPVFARWPRLAQEISSAAGFMHEGKMPMIAAYNDQAGFAAAIEEARISPFVLPLNWNFRYPMQRSFFGPLKIWHSYWDVPPITEQITTYYRRPDAIIQYTELLYEVQKPSGR